jgi:hypothetical protein
MFVLLVGYAVAAVALALGYDAIMPLAVLATAITIVTLRAWDRKYR